MALRSVAVSAARPQRQTSRGERTEGGDAAGHSSMGLLPAVKQMAELKEAVRRLRAVVHELPAERADRYARSARLRESRD